MRLCVPATNRVLLVSFAGAGVVEKRRATAGAKPAVRRQGSTANKARDHTGVAKPRAREAGVAA